MRGDTQHFGPAPGLSLVRVCGLRTKSIPSATGGLVTPGWSWVSLPSERCMVPGLARCPLHLCPGSILFGPGPSLQVGI